MKPPGNDNLDHLARAKRRTRLLFAAVALGAGLGAAIGLGLRLLGGGP